MTLDLSDTGSISHATSRAADSCSPRPILSRADEAHLQMGWQQITSIAAEYMAAAPELWSAPTVEEVRSQARHLAAAQWLYYTRHINEFFGAPELR